ncbi:MAG: hypothetical protein JXB19_01750 [Bacteroidales bacterium]|nr:hypothetical protein [Bacteroidales bacterium]
MAIFTEKYIFTQESIGVYAPNIGGVFGLYDSQKFAIYYGKSDNDIRDELTAHKSGIRGACSKMAFYFNAETGSDPVKRLKAILEEHKRIFEELPMCNEIYKRPDQ